MARDHQHRAAGGPHIRLFCAAVGALGLSILVVMTAAWTDTPLGAPPIWAWLLTGLQVLALRSAGTARWWGWLLGAAVQVPWIAYAVVTGQLGFIAGCAVSAVVQTRNFLEAGVTRRAVKVQDSILPAGEIVRRFVRRAEEALDRAGTTVIA